MGRGDVWMTLFGNLVRVLQIRAPELLREFPAFNEHYNWLIQEFDIDPIKSNVPGLEKLGEIVPYDVKSKESSEERLIDIMQSIRGNKTGRNGRTFEIRIPLRARELLRIDENSNFHVKVDLRRSRLILEVDNEKPKEKSVSQQPPA